jgi:hypothetical protein
VEEQQNEIQIESLENLPSGNYILKVQRGDEVFETLKLMKH